MDQIVERQSYNIHTRPFSCGGWMSFLRPPVTPTHHQQDEPNNHHKYQHKMFPNILCVECNAAIATVMVVGCGHLCLCVVCASMVRAYRNRCPVCNDNSVKNENGLIGLAFMKRFY